MSTAYFGDKAVSSMYWGGQPVAALAMGDTILWEAFRVPTEYLTFQSNTAFTISVATPYWEGTMYTSTDTETWDAWTGDSVSSSSGGTIYVCGVGNETIHGGYWQTDDYLNSQWNFSGATNLQCTGNIEVLLDWQTVANGGHPIMAEFCFYHVFDGCTSLIVAPTLSAITLAESCYSHMFKDCTGLTAAPSLPATTLASSCYSSMFYNCTGLTTVPSLPATTLATRCYSSMFCDCTGLTTAPSLPATTLATYCYYNMFYDCTSLTTVPSLPATTLASYCYGYMFYGCTSLTAAPSLPATTLATYCYYNMFYGCTSLTAASSLPATTLATYCYNYMFRGCTSLTIAPSLPATTLATYCYYGMFQNCTLLKANSSQGTVTERPSGVSVVYSYEWRIPTSGTIADAPSNWNTSMLSNTGGSYKSNPSINTSYYLEYEPV